MFYESWIQNVITAFATWKQALFSPEQFLAPALAPSQQTLITGVEFYFNMLMAALLLYAPLALTQGGQRGDRLRLTVNASVGLLFSAVIALTWHVSFWLFGGTASFEGTYIAYVYAASPYLPLFAVSSLILFAGLPPRLRLFAVNPATAGDAAKAARSDPETNHALMALGSLGGLGIMLWNFWVILRCFSYVHNLTGWSLAGAVVVSVVIAAPVGMILRKLAALFQSNRGADAEPHSMLIDYFEKELDRAASRGHSPSTVSQLSRDADQLWQQILKQSKQR